VPAVRGKFRWTAPNELVFSPAVGFDPATDYRAELTGDLGKQTDTRRSVSGEAISFHTPYLELENTEVWWARNRQSGRAEARARLQFNYAVDASQVTQNLKLSSDDKPLTGQPAPGTPGIVALTLSDVPTAKNEQPLRLALAKGIKVINTSYASKDPLEATGTIPAQNRIEIVSVSTSYETGGTRPQGVVRVVTTQELQPGRNAGTDLTTYYSIQPAITATAELTENGFILRGDFTETDTYVLTLTDQIRGTLGAKLDEPVTRDLFFGRMPASVSFTQKKALYLSAKGSRNIGLNIVNVPKVQVQIAKIYDNNILHFLRNSRYENYAEDSDGNYAPSGSYNYQQDGEQHYSDLLVNKTLDSGDLPRVNGVSALNLALPDAGPSAKGVYLVSVSAKDVAYLGATQLVSVSDIGLLTKKTAGQMLVWANSIRTAEPLKDVEITLISNSNQPVMTAKTNADGLATFEKIDEKLAGFGTPTLVGEGNGEGEEGSGSGEPTGPQVVLITARSGTATEDRPDTGDFNFLYLPDTQVETSRFDVGGERENPAALSAFVYGERNIYRPGETIHLNTVVRAENWKAADNIPVEIRLLLPNGREFVSLRKTTNGQGAVAADIPLGPAAVTGSYSVEVLNASGLLLASEQISVEEFIPDRIKVEVRTDRERYKTGQTLTVSATALNLFGPLASDRAYEAELQLKRKAFAPAGFGDYDFEIPSETNSVEKVLRQGRTNDNGQFTEAFVLPGALQDIGLLEGKLFVTVFDENGRPVNRLRRFDILTQDVFYGVKLAGRYVTTNAPLAAALVALTPDGQLKPGASASVQVVRFDYQTVVEKSGSQLKYTSKRREKIVYINTLLFKGGKADFRYVPTVSGEYEIRVRRPAGAGGAVPGYTATSFYAYGYNDTQASSFEVSTEGQVLLQYDKPTYQTGDRAKVLFTAPFDGKLLVTIERAGVLEHKWLETNNKTAEWAFSVTDALLPNAYVTATLIRPLDKATLPLTVAHGFAPLPVEKADTKLPVVITAVSQSRSKTKQTIRVKAGAGAQVTVAVVDEGILQLKNYQTPDPHGFFYQKRALEVTSHDLYALLFPELSLRSRSSTGGDGYDLEKRVNPMANGRVKLVTYWSGIVEAGFSGEAEVTLDIPQFSGNLRIMAVAWKDNAFGAAEQNMTVADPIVISTGLPRFLSPGDALDLPVNLTNTTKKPVTVTTTLSLSGPLMSDSIVNQQLTIPAGRESRALFHVVARQAIGAGAVSIAVRGLGETFTDRTDITVRPAVSLVKTTVSGAVSGGKSVSLSLASGFLPGTGKTLVTLSRSPALQFGRELSYLLGYPHGCLEQTISKAFPQIYFADLTKTMSQTIYFVRSGDSDLNPATNVRSAIQTVENAQLYSGGFSMWAGMNEVDNWTSAYAVHFLSSAQQAGYAVQGAVLAKGLDYLTQHSSAQNTEEIVTYDETGGRTVVKQPSRTNLYALYVLTLAGKPNRAALNYYKQNVGSLPVDSRYVLAAAFARLGDTRSYAALLPKTYTDRTTTRQTANSYASPLRNLALALDALLDSDPDNIQIPQMARQLSGAVRMSRYLNTQEAAFALLSLGKLARKTAASTATATLSGSGKTLGNFTGADLVVKRVPTGVPLTLSASGSGSVYYFAQSEGIPAGPADGVAEEDNGLIVRRTYLDRNGAPVSSFRQNDLIVVKVTVASTNGLRVGNVVVTDLLPAGFEVENPRLTELRGTDWLKNPSTPDHFDLRDDRVNFYTTATDKEQVFYYQARAVSRGRFRLGPVSADAMYNPDYRSYNGAGFVEVR
jgi:alpha-2-macroglobulin